MATKLKRKRSGYYKVEDDLDQPSDHPLDHSNNSKNLKNYSKNSLVAIEALEYINHLIENCVKSNKGSVNIKIYDKKCNFSKIKSLNNISHYKVKFGKKKYRITSNTMNTIFQQLVDHGYSTALGLGVVSHCNSKKMEYRRSFPISSKRSFNSLNLDFKKLDYYNHESKYNAIMEIKLSLVVNL